MVIFLSLILTIISIYIGFNEMKKYESISTKQRNLIFMFIILFGVVLYMRGVNVFTLLFGSTTPLLLSHLIIDIKEQELPDYNNLLIAVIGILFILIQFFNSNDISYLYNFATGIILFTIYFVIAIVTGGALGGGDIKLVGAMGLFFPINMTIDLLIYPIILGALIAIMLLIFKKGSSRDTKFAFGPAILVSFYLLALM